jgi:LacI family transcriptional regulator, galactose operon repressor
MNARASDVARRAGLSRAQVSNYFNRPDLVSADAKQRIAAAVDELGYVPDEAASALRRGTTKMLGLLLLDGWAPYFAEVTQAVDDEADRRGWYVHVASSSRKEGRELRHLTSFAAHRTRGLIVAPQGDIGEQLLALQARGMACVLLDPPRSLHLPQAIPSVAIDHVVGGALAGRHLLERGGRRFAFVGDPGQPHSHDRLTGFTEAVRTARPEAVVDVVETTDLSVGSGTQAAQAILGRAASDRPDAVFAANDLVAIGLLHAFATAGLNVPRDCRIVGYDDIALAAELATPLSTVRQPVTELGIAAVDLLLESIGSPRAAAARERDQAPGVPGDVPHVVLHPEFVTRATT